MSIQRRTLELIVLPKPLSVCRLDPEEDVPAWVGGGGGGLTNVTRTSDELSIIAASSVVPTGVRRSDGWRALKLQGPFAFSETGVLASVVAPLAEAGISTLAICTFDTDYILVQESDLRIAIGILERAGHWFSGDAASKRGDQVRDECDPRTQGGKRC